MASTSDLSKLQPWLQTYIARLTPAARKKLLRQIGRDVLRKNRTRMVNQRNPDGEIWPARKPQPNHSPAENRRKLFTQLRRPKSLRQRLYADGVRVGFFSGAARIARIHHYGLKQQLEFGVAQYPKRELLGINRRDAQMIEQAIINHLGGDT